MTANVVSSGDKSKVFLVHGRDHRIAQAMQEFLRALRLEVVEWEHAVQSTGEAAPYVGDVVLAGMRMADAVVVLLTPDDLVRLRPDLLDDNDSANERDRQGQARANVIYEAGIADALDRARTVLVEVGPVKSLSDLGGRNVVRFDGSTKTRNQLANRMRQAHLEVDTAGGAWLRSGDFGGVREALWTAKETLREQVREQVGNLSLTLSSPVQGAFTGEHEIDIHGYVSLEGLSGAKAVSVLEKRKLEVVPFVRPLTTRDPRARAWYSQNRPSIDQDGNINGKIRIGPSPPARHGSGEDFAIVLLAVPKGFVHPTATDQKFDNLPIPNVTVSETIRVHRL